MNRDFLEMLDALSAEGVRYLVVDAYAVAVHGYPRATGDLDLWIRPDPENAARTWQALTRFRAPLDGLAREDLEQPGLIFMMGREPNRIDLLTEVTGLEFDTAWDRRIEIEMLGRSVPVLGLEDLIRNKKATGRPKDLLDIECLEGRSGS